MTPGKEIADNILPGNVPEPGVTSPPPEIVRCNSLELIIDLTGEMAHLNELIMMYLDKNGGFTTPEHISHWCNRPSIYWKLRSVSVITRR